MSFTTPAGSSISGQPVEVSGQIVQVSGQQVEISGQPIAISGQILPIINASGQTLPVATSISGNAVSISGEAITTSISGQPIAIVSGTLVSSIISVYSGAGVITSISGNIVPIINASGQTLPVTTSVSGNIVYAQLSGTYLPALVSGTGITVGGVNYAHFSGVIATVASGQPGMVDINWDHDLIVDPDDVNASGYHVNVGSMALASGLGVVTSISGQAPKTPTIAVLPNASSNLYRVTANSGGTYLASGIVAGVIAIANSGNSAMVLWGGTSSLPWFASTNAYYGMVLYPGDQVAMSLNNFNALYFVAQVSGDIISLGGVL
jgi:hypothetical protein